MCRNPCKTNLCKWFPHSSSQVALEIEKPDILLKNCSPRSSASWLPQYWCSKETHAAGAALKKSSGRHGSYDATASSSECIESLQSFRRGLRCRLSDASGSSYGHQFMIGLVSTEAACPQHPQQALLRNSVEFQSISYAACHQWHWLSFNVYESGKRIGEFGTVRAGDVIELRLTREDLPKVEYCVNGTPRHTSSEGPPKQARIFGKVCAARQSPLVEDLQWILESAP